MSKPGTRLLDMDEDDDDVGSRYFTVEGVSKTLDGLEVRVHSPTQFGFAEVSVIRRQGLLVGDRPWQEAVFPGMLLIAKRCLRLSSVQDEMEFSSKNDFGKHLGSSSTMRGKLALAWTWYENAVTADLNDISVTPTKKLFTRTWYDKKHRDVALDLIRSFAMLTTSVDDIEKELRSIA